MAREKEILEQVRSIWHIQVRDVEEGKNGFHWWPGHHKVTVTCVTSKDSVALSDLDPDPDVCCLKVSTEVVKGIDLGNPKVRAVVAHLGNTAPSYAWTYVPPEVTKKYELPNDGAIWFHSAVYVTAETATWLPAFFARLAIMQAIDAERMAAVIAQTLGGGAANLSGPRHEGLSGDIDDILYVGSPYRAVGQEPSKWAGSAEFASIGEQFGNSDMCFGTGDGSGLTLETPFGSGSALIRLNPDVPHPALGNGLLSTVELPAFESLDTTEDTCMWLNFFSWVQWTKAPVLATWRPRQVGDKYVPACGTHIPNALYANGLATNVALWSIGLARWARQTLRPDLKDVPMMEVYAARFAPPEGQK